MRCTVTAHYHQFRFFWMLKDTSFTNCDFGRNPIMENSWKIALCCASADFPNTKITIVFRFHLQLSNHVQKALQWNKCIAFALFEHRIHAKRSAHHHHRVSHERTTEKPFCDSKFLLPDQMLELRLERYCSICWQVSVGCIVCVLFTFNCLQIYFAIFLHILSFSFICDVICDVYGIWAILVAYFQHTLRFSSHWTLAFGRISMKIYTKANAHIRRKVFSYIFCSVWCALNLKLAQAIWVLNNVNNVNYAAA